MVKDCPHVDTADWDPDGRFCCRMTYMRKHAGLALSFQGGTRANPRGFWHDKTIKSEQAKIIAQAKAKGNEAVPYKSIFGNT